MNLFHTAVFRGPPNLHSLVCERMLNCMAALREKLGLEDGFLTKFVSYGPVPVPEDWPDVEPPPGGLTREFLEGEGHCFVGILGGAWDSHDKDPKSTGQVTLSMMLNALPEGTVDPSLRPFLQRTIRHELTGCQVSRGIGLLEVITGWQLLGLSDPEISRLFSLVWEGLVLHLCEFQPTDPRSVPIREKSELSAEDQVQEFLHREGQRYVMHALSAESILENCRPALGDNGFAELERSVAAALQAFWRDCEQAELAIQGRRWVVLVGRSDALGFARLARRGNQSGLTARGKRKEKPFPGRPDRRPPDLVVNFCRPGVFSVSVIGSTGRIRGLDACLARRLQIADLEARGFEVRGTAWASLGQSNVDLISRLTGSDGETHDRIRMLHFPWCGGVVGNAFKATRRSVEPSPLTERQVLQEVAAVLSAGW
ncbi:MAG: hypothetical protein ABIJ46_04795 [bacterium]